MGKFGCDRMSTNVTIEYIVAQKKYHEAKTREEKIAALEGMLTAIPKHKGTEVMRAEMKSKLAKLREKSPKKSAGFVTSIKKEGDVQVCLIGLTQSGKSTLLSKLTDAKPKISNRPFTTTKPQVGVAEWTGVKFQIIEIPSTFQPQFLSIAQNADGIIFVYDSTKDLKLQGKEFQVMRDAFRLHKIYINTQGKKEPNVESIFQKLWDKLTLIRVYTKEPDKKPEKKALVLRKNGTVKDAANKVHKDFVRLFKFARVWGKSVKHQGTQVGLEHVLKDGDVVEIHAG